MAFLLLPYLSFFLLFVNNSRVIHEDERNIILESLARLITLSV